MGDAAAFKSSKFWPVPWPPTMTSDYVNSIALRLCQIADGQYDCCVTLRPKNDWDMAAADLIPVGSRAVSAPQAAPKNLSLNRERPLHEHIVAATPGLVPAIMKRVTPALEKMGAITSREAKNTCLNIYSEGYRRLQGLSMQRIWQKIWQNRF